MRHLSAGISSILAAPAQTKLRYYGYVVRETAGQPAQVIIRNGVDGGGTALATITLAAHESRSDWPEAGGAESSGGLYVERVSGTAEVAVFYRN